MNPFETLYINIRRRKKTKRKKREREQNRQKSHENMGSLPNLHELERIRRKLENEREEARREQRAREQRESSCDRGGISGVRSGGDRLPFFLHPSHHQVRYKI